MSGFDLVRRVREGEESRIIPIILLTARREADDIAYGLNLGADEFVRKPFDREASGQNRVGRAEPDRHVGEPRCELHVLEIEDEQFPRLATPAYVVRIEVRRTQTRLRLQSADRLGKPVGERSEPLQSRLAKTTTSPLWPDRAV